MIIEVYQRHIDRGFGGEGAELLCPIAIAMTEQLGVKMGVWKGRAWNIVTGESYTLPEEVTRKYIKYDHTGMMNPFEFELAEEVTVVKAATV
jgi:hypothetical protein